MTRFLLLALAALLPETAHASTCLVFPIGDPGVHDLLGNGGALYVSWPQQTSPFERMFRLRAPDGTLVPWTADRLDTTIRFLPEEPLAAGTYTLEHLHRFAELTRMLDGGGVDEGRLADLEKIIETYKRQA